MDKSKKQDEKPVSVTVAARPLKQTHPNIFFGLYGNDWIGYIYTHLPTLPFALITDKQLFAS